MARWYWTGDVRIDPPDPEQYRRERHALPESDWPHVTNIQLVEGRAYVVIEALGSKFFWFVIDLEGLDTEGAPEGHEWVHLVLDGNISPALRNTEHFRKNETNIHPSYLAEKFPNWAPPDYEVMALFMIPFLTQIFTMEPFGGADVQ